MNVRLFGDELPRLGVRVWIDPAAVVIGRVEIGDDASLWPMAVARGDVNTISIGARTNVQDGSVLHVTHDGPYSPGGLPLVIGADVTIGHRVMLHACTIGDRCLIGMSSTVLDGAVLEDEVFLAAGTLVPPGKRLQGRSLYRGSPAQRVRSLSDEELAMLRYSAEHYVRLKDRYLGD
ncbi:gamma carbonic anhydrase family protein [Thioalkalivibrio sp. XN279]|uniref:gamma carbonic anhydrase family protein n=1 Tax=Thioalkalivibrio sp. XN279 TaxID=2714953 RepID=UPI00140DE61C|nr:gamma carbonic anhydrase family protein [Thioalkalivibrio sp. XN279]